VIPPGSLAPGKPDHPIYLPPPTPGHPIYIPPDAVAPGVPSHPIVLPPPGIWGGAPPYPDIGGPGDQPGIWPSPGVPTHPIALPEPPEEIPQGKSLLALYTPGKGWESQIIPTPGPGYTPPSGGATPTPQA
jgi:hypothetical protein